MSAALNEKIENSTDATRGQPIGTRVMTRKDELEVALAECSPENASERAQIETALATCYSLMTGDLENPSDVVAHSLNDWLERNKYLA